MGMLEDMIKLNDQLMEQASNFPAVMEVGSINKACEYLFKNGVRDCRSEKGSITNMPVVLNKIFHENAIVLDCKKDMTVINIKNGKMLKIIKSLPGCERSASEEESLKPVFYKMLWNILGVEDNEG